MPSKGLVIMDMLNDFADEKGRLYCGETARKIVPFALKRMEKLF